MPTRRGCLGLGALAALCVAVGAGAAAGCTGDQDCVPSFDKCDGPIACVAGNCVTFPPDCDDGDACTDDACQATAPGNGCIHTPHCPDDGAVCNGAPFCLRIPIGFGTFLPFCIAASPPDCDDKDACSIDSCVEPTGCTHVAVGCNDGDLCTTDTCDPAQGCLHEPIAGCCRTTADCPSDACTTDRACVAHACTPGHAVVCDDADVCTVDACGPAVGCTHEPVAGCCNADANCAPSGDPCIPETCGGAHTCAAEPVAGFDAVACVCARPVPAVCAGAVPRRVTRRLARACALIARAPTAGRGERKLLGRAATLLARAGGGLRRPRGGGVTPPCATALTALLGDDRGRVESLLDRPR